MGRKILVCIPCRLAIFSNSATNKAPRYKGDLRHPNKIQEIKQDDLRDFRKLHKDSKQHKLVEVELLYD